MSNGTWQGIPTTGNAPNQNLSTEAISAHSDENGDLVVDAIGYASDGSAIPDPPAGVKLGPLFHKAAPFSWSDPKVAFNSSGIASNDGFAPGGVWYSKGDTTGSPSNPNGGPPAAAARVALSVLAKYFARK